MAKILQNLKIFDFICFLASFVKRLNTVLKMLDVPH